MKIINSSTNCDLWKAGKLPFVGFISGPVRIIGGLIQVIINTVLTIFTAIASLNAKIPQSSSWHPVNLLNDAKLGGLHILRGSLEFLPFYSIIIYAKNKDEIDFIAWIPENKRSDHPFRFV
jgi:hypothetical protein